MPRLEIPALYRLDVGSGLWGWHKMSDLATAVNNIIERSALDPLSTEEIGKQFVHLNKEKLFAWSDEKDIDFVSPDEVPWSNPDLFVPAQWSMNVIKEIRRRIGKD